MYNSFINDYIVYESREYGLNIKWMKDSRERNLENWVIDGLGLTGTFIQSITLRNRSSAVQSQPYMLYGDRKYGVNLVWGRRPQRDNITLLLTGAIVLKRDVLPTSTSAENNLRSRALTQGDIIGSDYSGRPFIGVAPAERNQNINQNRNTWYPINGYKNTFCGTVDKYSVFDGKPAPISDNDDDMNIDLVPLANSSFDRMLKNMWGIAGRKQAQHVRQEKLKREIINSTSFDHVQAEIDVHDDTFKSHIYPGKGSAPKKGDYICTYGPYVMDKDHGYKPEIHPAEQIWWKQTDRRGTTYYLYAMCDVSDRFDDRFNFDTDDGKLSFRMPWAAQPLSETFAIFFELERGQRIDYNISKVAAINFFPFTIQSKNRHSLVSLRDTLVSVNELDGLDVNIKFEKVSRNTKTGKIQGFILLQMQLGVVHENIRPPNDDDAGGGIVLRIHKTITTQ